jgi:hypothetical protein
MTIKEIANIIADGLDRPVDGFLIERLKRLIILTYNELVREQVDKYKYDSTFRIFYVVNSLIPVNSFYGTTIDTGVRLLRTENKIPKPVRLKRPQPFYYVGSVDGSNSFVYTDYAMLAYIQTIPLIGTGIRYFYRDDYIYIYNNLLIESIGIDSAFESLLVPENSDLLDNNIYFTQNMEFPAPMDVISKVIELVPIRFLNITDTKDKVEAGHIDNN